jgi:hypothetical protein
MLTKDPKSKFDLKSLSTLIGACMIYLSIGLSLIHYLNT